MVVSLNMANEPHRFSKFYQTRSMAFRELQVWLDHFTSIGIDSAIYQARDGFALYRELTDKEMQEKFGPKEKEEG